jgi:hypothetical protein
MNFYFASSWFFKLLSPFTLQEPSCASFAAPPHQAVHNALHPQIWPRGHVARCFSRQLVYFYLCSRVLIDMRLEVKRGR